MIKSSYHLLPFKVTAILLTLFLICIIYPDDLFTTGSLYLSETIFLPPKKENKTTYLMILSYKRRTLFFSKAPLSRTIPDT